MNKEIFEVAEEVIRMAQKLRTGANVHAWTCAIGMVQCHMRSLVRLDEMENSEEVQALKVESMQALLMCINNLRSMILNRNA